MAACPHPSPSPQRQRSLPIRIDNTPWTNYHGPRRQRSAVPLRRNDSPGPFSIGALTLMDTRTTPSCLRIRILCRQPALPSLSSLKHKVSGEQLLPRVLCGCRLVKSRCLCLYFASRSRWSWRGRGIISDSCQPSALFGIMFLLGVILQLQKSCCLYSEKQRGDRRWVAGFAPTDLKRKKINKVSVTLEPTCLQNIRKSAIARKAVHSPIIALLIKKNKEKETYLLGKNT